MNSWDSTYAVMVEQRDYALVPSKCLDYSIYDRRTTKPVVIIKTRSPLSYEIVESDMFYSRVNEYIPNASGVNIVEGYYLARPLSL